MVENGGVVRRSRRAASLTAQVLWNFQIEEDKNSNVVAKIRRKPSISKEEMEKMPQISALKGRKRSIVNTEETSRDEINPSHFHAKKKKIVGGYSGHIFPINKPLHVTKEAGVVPKKLTASVAPLVKSQPTYPKTVHSPSVTPIPNTPSHVNPILLLPVSLQGNQGFGIGTHPAEVGGLSLVTLKASSDLFNCFGLNKPNISHLDLQKPWNSLTTNIPTTPSTVERYNAKIRHSMLSNTVEGRSTIKPIMEQPQVEPLNLKMGETTVPSFKSSSFTKPKVAFVQPMSASSSIQSCEAAVTSKVTPEPVPSAEQPKKTNAASLQTSTRTKLKRRKSRASPVNVGTSKQTPSVVSTCRKRHAKCPSPDYACSSPDVDDVHREPRHTCLRKQINLRHKAAPAPESKDYEVFVEMQRRLLAEAKRAQRAKAKARAKSIAKKEQIEREVTVESRPISAPENLKPLSKEQQNNGWQWTGKPYTCRVFSVEHSKYVARCCYPGMCRMDKRTGTTDYVFVRDCVFLLAVGEEELSYIAKVTALWEKPNTKEMMVSLVWYYRPEHTDDVSKNADVSEDELFASRHQDEISVACVEERCNVLTYSQFCRVQAKARRNRMWTKDDLRRIVPVGTSAPKGRPMFPGETPISSRDMFYCRYIYDVLQRKIKPKLPPPTSLTH